MKPTANFYLSDKSEPRLQEIELGQMWFYGADPYKFQISTHEQYKLVLQFEPLLILLESNKIQLIL